MGLSLLLLALVLFGASQGALKISFDIALPRFLAEPAWGTFNAWIPLFMFKVYIGIKKNE